MNNIYLKTFRTITRTFLVFYFILSLCNVPVLAQSLRPGLQKELKLFDAGEGGSGAISIRAAAGTASYALSFPAVAPAIANLLTISSIDGSNATLGWASIGDMAWRLGGNNITDTATQFLGTTNNQFLKVRTNNKLRMYIGNDNTNQAMFYSTLIAAGGFFEGSDMRQKNVLRRDGDVAYFTWKDGRDNLSHIGYIAQEVQKTHPDQVITDYQGNLSVNYTELLVEKIRMLEKRIEELEKKKRRKK